MHRILSFLLALTIIGSCDTVEAPYIEPNSLNCNYDDDAPVRKVLIEDFTGYQCVNCPRATDELKSIVERYPCHVIPVAIHYGFFAEPAFGTEDPDYRTPEGAAIGEYFEVTQALPIGMVNRRAENGNYNLDYEDWAIKLVEQVTASLYADVEILASANFTADSLLEYSIEINDISILNVNMHVVASLLENKVISKQKDGSQTVYDYEHNHMLRAGVMEDPIWGTPANLPFNRNFSYAVPSGVTWNLDNMELLVYVYNSDTKEIIQAEVFHIDGI